MKKLLESIDSIQEAENKYGEEIPSWKDEPYEKLPAQTPQETARKKNIKWINDALESYRVSGKPLSDVHYQKIIAKLESLRGKQASNNMSGALPELTDVGTPTGNIKHDWDMQRFGNMLRKNK